MAQTFAVVANGNTVETTGMDASDLLQVLTLGGDDSLIVDINLTVAISTPIFFDGGSGADRLTVQGTPIAPLINTVAYTMGLQPDEGRLRYLDAGGARLMSIDFDNLEPVFDNVLAANLTVNGNGSANAITVSAPQGAALATVSVDGFETITFNNKTDLSINAAAGDDIIDVNIAATATIPALSTITINANDGNDTVRFQNLPMAAGFASATVNAGTGNDTIDASNIPATTTKLLTLNGEEGDDIITGGAGNDTISGGEGDDVLVIHAGTDTISGNGGADTLKFLGNAAVNTFTVTPTAAAAFSFTSTNSFGNGSVAHSGMDSFRVELGDGNDQLIVNLANAQLINGLPIAYDGGVGQNTLVVQGNFGGGAPLASATYTPGLAAG